MTFEIFCRQRGIDYHESAMDIPVDLYCRYGEAFQRALVPEVTETKAVDIAKAADGFHLVFENREAVTARRVVLAIGVHAFAHIPEMLDALPQGAVSHSGDYGPLDRLDRRRVVVVGSGASALDLSAQLHERGISVSIVSRATELRFASPPLRTRRSLLRRIGSPGSGIGSGWLLWACANAPGLFHDVPGPLRRHIVRHTLGPLGGAGLRTRVLGKVATHLGWRIDGADWVDGRVELRLSNRSGVRQLLGADHIVAATGYRTDVERLGFLDPSLRRSIRTVDGAPVLSQDYESSVPGLHFIGPASADSFGPVARFVFGAVHPARRLARRFSADLARERNAPRRERSLAAEGA